MIVLWAVNLVMYIDINNKTTMIITEIQEAGVRRLIEAELEVGWKRRWK